MISKKNRLTTREFGKVLSHRKPFFSYMLIANVYPKKSSVAKVGIMLSSKCSKGSVNRNFFRRRFYDLSRNFLPKLNSDVVLFPKKGTILHYKDMKIIAEFEKNVIFLFEKITHT